MQKRGLASQTTDESTRNSIVGIGKERRRNRNVRIGYSNTWADPLVDEELFESAGNGKERTTSRGMRYSLGPSPNLRVQWGT